MDLNLLELSKRLSKCSRGKEYNCAVFEWTSERKKGRQLLSLNYYRVVPLKTCDDLS